ncbi:MAG: amidohydrolase family protein, partial [Rhodobacteraceae bacterium]|nr:amidohydrolase family protein [Paracoccaceae bacterium]
SDVYKRQPIESLRGFLDRTAATAARWHDPSDDAMTRVACAPITPNFNFVPEALPEIAAEARHLGLRLHAHLSENEGYAAQTLASFGQRPVPWLASKDWLGPDVWFAHLVDLTPDEITMLAETGTAMAHCPQANARLGSGIAPAPALYAKGGTVSLAVDGAGANEAAHMGGVMYAAFALHRAALGVAGSQVRKIIHWATQGGAQTLGLPKVGTLAPGMTADIALFDLSAPQNLGLHDPALAPVITGSATVRHSLVAGRFVVRDGQIPHLEMPTLAADAARTTANLAQFAKDLEPA